MPIFRVKRTRHFFTMPNCLAQDTALSYKALGVMTYLLSKPDDWTVKRRDLFRTSDGDASMRAALTELQQAGYIHLTSWRDEKGHIRWEYHVFDEPQFPQKLPPKTPKKRKQSTENQEVSPHVENQHAAEALSCDFPRVENPRVDFPRVGNQHAYKELNLQKTEKTKKESSYQNSPMSPSANGTHAEGVTTLFATEKTPAEEEVSKVQRQASGARRVPPCYSPGFQQFWGVWPDGPRKTKKTHCFGLWKRHKLEPRAQEVCGKVEAWKETDKWRRGFDPMPSSWITALEYEDEVPQSLQSAHDAYLAMLERVIMKHDTGQHHERN